MTEFVGAINVNAKIIKSISLAICILLSLFDFAAIAGEPLPHHCDQRVMFFPGCSLRDGTIQA